jgi:hypothetical protein
MVSVTPLVLLRVTEQEDAMQEDDEVVGVVPLVV